jgi:Tfp pilus assembly protein PilZ
VIKKERRKSQRVKKALPLEINNEEGMLVDISRGGLGISPEIIPVGETIFVKIKINKEIVNLQGKIKWITFRKAQAGACHVGFSITKAPESYYKLVENMQQGGREGDFIH